jgi:hypothetical protein
MAAVPELYAARRFAHFNTGLAERCTETPPAWARRNRWWAGLSWSEGGQHGVCSYADLDRIQQA